MTFTARILAICALIFCGSLDPSRLSGADRRSRPIQSVPSGRPVNFADAWAHPAISQNADLIWKSLHDIGSGKAIVFSPDLSEPGNRQFFHTLGFQYFEDPDWRVVIQQIKDHNESHPENRIETLLIQSHGTNGDALKLQRGNQPDAARSYIAPAALQERLEGSGVRVCVLAACNAGRLFREENYRAVRKGEGNRLFEPPTLGIINASPDYDAIRASMIFVRRTESHIELINECRLAEFSPATQAAVEGGTAKDKTVNKIAVPEILIQLLLRDDSLHLVAGGSETEISRTETNENYREKLITRFLKFVNSVADRKNS